MIKTKNYTGNYTLGHGDDVFTAEYIAVKFIDWTGKTQWKLIDRYHTEVFLFDTLKACVTKSKELFKVLEVEPQLNNSHPAGDNEFTDDENAAFDAVDVSNTIINGETPAGLKAKIISLRDMINNPDSSKYAIIFIKELILQLEDQAFHVYKMEKF